MELNEKERWEVGFRMLLHEERSIDGAMLSLMLLNGVLLVASAVGVVAYYSAPDAKLRMIMYIGLVIVAVLGSRACATALMIHKSTRSRSGDIGVWLGQVKVDGEQTWLPACWHRQRALARYSAPLVWLLVGIWLFILLALGIAPTLSGS